MTPITAWFTFRWGRDHPPAPGYATWRPTPSDGLRRAAGTGHSVDKMRHSVRMGQMEGNEDAATKVRGVLDMTNRRDFFFSGFISGALVMLVLPIVLGWVK